MDDLRIAPVDGDRMLERWRHVHNLIVPPDELSPDEVRERSGRHRLENACLGDALVGCSTVRPPEGEDAVRRSSRGCCPSTAGAGSGRPCTSTVSRTRALGAQEIRTVVRAANTDGLRFAEARGFAEVERYVAPEDETEVWLTLRLES